MIRVAIIGYGNIGRAVEEAAKTAQDIELVGIYHHGEINDQMVNEQMVNAVDVAVLCTPTRETPAYAERLINPARRSSSRRRSWTA